MWLPTVKIPQSSFEYWKRVTDSRNAQAKESSYYINHHDQKLSFLDGKQFIIDIVPDEEEDNLPLSIQTQIDLQFEKEYARQCQPVSRIRKSNASSFILAAVLLAGAGIGFPFMGAGSRKIYARDEEEPKEKTKTDEYYLKRAEEKRQRKLKRNQ